MTKYTNLSTQPPWVRTPGPTKLEPSSILDRNNLIPDQPPLLPKQDLRHGLPTRPKPPQHNLDPSDIPQQTPLLDLLEHKRTQLVRGVVAATARLPEANVAGRHGHEDVDDFCALGDVLLRRLREGDVRVVLCGVDVEAVRLAVDPAL